MAHRAPSTIRPGTATETAAAPDLTPALQALLDRLACPNCHSALEPLGDSLQCSACASRFGVSRGSIDLRPHSREEVQGDETAWLEHWSAARQRTAVQRFFSLYRKLVFARTVQHFADAYLPARGVLVEAGSGTSETSRRIDKRGGARLLVAVDLVPAVLEHCDPVMDARIAGDIFRLPFTGSSLDGIWNVGVMEHFTADQIDAILKEFHRVLRPGGRVLLLWPGTSSLPQRLLGIAETLINLRSLPRRFRFHPPEISKLASTSEGLAILSRNGFEPIAADAGAKSLMAFRTLVAAKPGLA